MILHTDHSPPVFSSILYFSGWKLGPARPTFSETGLCFEFLLVQIHLDLLGSRFPFNIWPVFLVFITALALFFSPSLLMQTLNPWRDLLGKLWGGRLTLSPLLHEELITLWPKRGRGLTAALGGSLHPYICVSVWAWCSLYVSVWSCHVKLNFYAVFSACIYSLCVLLKRTLSALLLEWTTHPPLLHKISPRFIAHVTGMLLESLFFF